MFYVKIINKANISFVIYNSNPGVIMPTNRKLKLDIDFVCFRDLEMFASSHNSIRMLSQFPDYEQDNFRSLIKTLGTSQSYRYSTTGEYSEENGSAQLSYVEDPAVGLGGETIHLRFDTDETGRKALLMEREPNPMRLIFSPVITVNYLNINGIRTEISTVAKKLVNTITETGGRLLIDYELILFGMSMYRSRMEIKAVPLTGTPDMTEAKPLFFDAGRA